jgi:4-hydroxythreonine-4-phosphate dehydrogenase
MNTITLAVTAGDYNGIGPEIIIKALDEFTSKSASQTVLFCAREVLERTFGQFSTALQAQFKPGYLSALASLHPDTKKYTFDLNDFTPGKSTHRSGESARLYLSDSIACWKRGECDCVVTAPIVKYTFFSPDDPYPGQTEWIAHQVGCRQSLMMMVKKTFRVALVTTHIPLRNISSILTTQLIIEKGKLFLESLQNDFGIKHPRIAVCGLNPHSGEQGRFGDEEKTIITPAIEQLKPIGGEWYGPLAPDTVFEESIRIKFDGIVSLYHDQGLIPFKMQCGFTGVNFTAGLPIVRTSPDHGPALDRAGTGTADCRGLLEALFVAQDVANRRTKNR